MDSGQTGCAYKFQRRSDDKSCLNSRSASSTILCMSMRRPNLQGHVGTHPHTASMRRLHAPPPHLKRTASAPYHVCRVLRCAAWEAYECYAVPGASQSQISQQYMAYVLVFQAKSLQLLVSITNVARPPEGATYQLDGETTRRWHGNGTTGGSTRVVTSPSSKSHIHSPKHDELCLLAATTNTVAYQVHVKNTSNEPPTRWPLL